MVSQSGSFCVSNCLPPEWNASPPASGASGCIRSKLESGSPGATSLVIVRKFRRDCSSVHSLTPSDRVFHLERLSDGVKEWTEEQSRRNFRSEEHTSELQSRGHLVCRLLLEKKK